ncbi:hypothetical protein [Geothrix terrae]|uniref:hypothetical protein n=1 Tax=Geothrix terrae TaxID=2922720 RepID=UPI001FAC25BF|nr:hypothetical protein [Geothrix terrae]
MKKRMPQKELDTLKRFIEEKISEAEDIWQQVVPDIMELAEDGSLRKFAKAITQIPGYEEIEEDINVVDDFVILMADMRNSTKHLTTACSDATQGATGLKRLFIETSILLPAMAKTISFGKGKTLEYLGDGVLAAYRVKKGTESSVIYDAHHSAEKIVECVVDIINPLIKHYYNLPPLSVGIGIARSQGIVRMVGIENFLVPKVFGKSVFYASKLCGGENEIYLDEMAHGMWPKVKPGEKAVVSFKKIPIIKNGEKSCDGYKIQYNE